MDNNNTLKFVWAHMIERGKLTTGEWSYYGGDWESSPSTWKWEEVDAANKAFKEKVKSVGVDWDKTKEPESSMESAFTDTFHDSDTVETLLGTIVLKDGSEYLVGVGNSDINFGEYIKLIRRQLEDQQRMKDIFGD